MKYLMPILLIILLTTSCQKSSLKSQKAKLRIENISNQVFKNVSLISPDGNFDYNTILKMETSPYIDHETVYPFAFISLEINGELLKIQPKDYINSAQFLEGNFTYQIDYIADSSMTGHSLQLKFIED